MTPNHFRFFKASSKYDQLKQIVEEEKDKLDALQSQDKELNEELQRLEALTAAADKRYDFINFLKFLSIQKLF